MFGVAGLRTDLALSFLVSPPFWLCEVGRGRFAGVRGVFRPPALEGAYPRIHPRQQPDNGFQTDLKWIFEGGIQSGQIKLLRRYTP